MKFELPKPTGEYIVGITDFDVDTGREETIVGHEGERRRLSCRIFYPANREGEKKAEYMTRNFARCYKADYDKKTAAGENVIEAYHDVEAKEGMKFPLIIFNHGFGAFRESNTGMCLDIASHGYIVVSIGHPYEAELMEYTDGTVIYKDKKAFNAGVPKPVIPSLTEYFKIRKMKGDDVKIAERFNVFKDKYYVKMPDRIDAWAEDTEDVRKYVTERYADRIDTDAGIGITGHSFGGAVAHLMLRKNPEYTCGINIDGALFGRYEGYKLTKPFMNINCEGNRNFTRNGYIDSDADGYLALFSDMQHQGFSDMKFFMNLAIMVGKLPKEILHRNLCSLHVQFFDKFLKGKDISISSSDPDYVKIMKKGNS